MELNLNGTSGISGVDGSASTPALQGSDSNTGVSFGSDIVAFNTGGTERSRFDSNGNLLIGSTSYNAGAFGGNARGINVAGIMPQVLLHETDNDKDAYIGINNSEFFVHTGDEIAIRFGTNDTERMRISSDGTLQMTGDVGTGDAQHFKFFASGDVVHLKTGGTNAANHGMIQFRDGNNSFCGQITSHGTNHTTSYGTSSDYRLKENEVLISDGITRLKQLKPYRFQWKSSGETQDGFFAHEAQTVVPEAIQGEKDAVDSDNNPVYQGIDQSKLVPLLTAALQEAVGKIETLETKVAALEAA